MKPFPYAKLARAFAPPVGPSINALGHCFIKNGQVEMLCRPCGFVIWKVDDERGAEEAVHQLGGGPCPALAAATGTAKTRNAAECEASQSGGSASERNAQKDPSHD